MSMEERRIIARSEDSKARKRGAIVEAAAERFAVAGYAGTSMVDIARAAGVGKGTLYEYFKSKEELFLAVFGWFCAFLVDETAKAVSGPDTQGQSASERLLAMNDTIMASLDDMGDYYGLFMEFWAAAGVSSMRDKLRPLFRHWYQQFRTIVAAIIEQGRASGEFSQDADPDSLAASLVGAWDALGLQAWFDKEFDAPKASGAFIRTMLKGMA